MDPELIKWLESRKLGKKVMKMLHKEQLITVDVICHVKEEDLQSLKTQYSLSMGQLIQLRAARDAMLEGEFASSTQANVHNDNHEPSSSETEETGIDTQHVEIDPNHDQHVAVGSVPEPSQHYNKLQKGLEEAEKLNKKGHTLEASKQTQAVVEGAQVLLDGIKTDNSPENLSQKIGHIDNTVNAFRTHNQQKWPCCLLL